MAYSTAKKQREALSVYKAANRASIRAWNREWRKRREAEDPEFKAKARAAERRWYAQNRRRAVAYLERHDSSGAVRLVG